MQKLVVLISLILIPSLLAAAPSRHIQVSITPSSTTVVSGGTQQFSASVSGTSNKSVMWSASAGTISSSGVFTAPAVAQSTTVYVQVSSTADPTKSATAMVAVAPSTSTTTPTQHIVDLGWNGSTSTDTSGYNVYRGTTSAGPYSKVNSGGLIASTLYTDTNVVSGQTYYYVVTAVDISGVESGYSNETQAVVPSP